MATIIKTDLDIEEGATSYENVANPTYKYFQTEEKLHGFLSQQFPTIANPVMISIDFI